MEITNNLYISHYQKNFAEKNNNDNRNFSEILEDAQKENKKASPHAVSAKEVELLGGAMFVNAVR